MENQQYKATHWSEIRNHLGQSVSKHLATTVSTQYQVSFFFFLSLVRLHP